MRQTEDAGKRGRKRQAQCRERGQKRACTEFFLETPCKTQKTTPPPAILAIHHHGRTALIMPWAEVTTAQKALKLRKFE
jgi:hypothetical protein